MGGGAPTSRRVYAPRARSRGQIPSPWLDGEPACHAGVGFDDYYGPGTDVAGYVGAGAKGSVPLTFILSAFGSWKLSADVALIL